MNEVFAEHIVKRKMTLNAYLARVGMIFLVGTGLFLSFTLLGAIGLSITILIIYLTYIVFVNTDVEYEYSVVNNELIIDKIMGMKKRKRLKVYDLKKAEAMAYVKSGLLNHYSQTGRTIDYTSGYKCDMQVGIVFPSEQGSIIVYFDPNERIMESINKVCPRLMKEY